MNRIKPFIQATVIISMIIIGLFIFVPTSIIHAWDEGVHAVANCKGWKITADPETFNVDKETRWVPVTITGTGESDWQNGETQHSYDVNVKWRKEIRDCTWHGCSNWHSTNQYYQEDHAGKVQKPRDCHQPDPSPTPSPCPSESPTPTPSPTASPTPSPTPSDSPEPSPTPVESPTPSPTPVVNPSPTPDDGKSGARSAINVDRVTCGNTDFDAVFDIHQDGNGVKDVKVTFTFNGQTKDTLTNEDGHAKVQFPLVDGYLQVTADGFPSQAQTVNAPVGCPTVASNVKTGQVLGASTLADTGSESAYEAFGLILAGIVFNIGGAYAYLKTKKN